MGVAIWTALFAIALFVAMIGLGELGRRLALRRAGGGEAHGDGDGGGVSVLDGAVFGLLGLIVAFSFGGAVDRFDAHRGQIIAETNAIGSTYDLLDLLPEEARAPLQEDFRRYLDTRIAVYRILPDLDAAAAELAVMREIETEIWTAALAATRGDQAATMLLLPAIDETFDIATERTLSMLMHPPPVIFGLMFVLALASAVLAGYGMPRSRDWVRLVGFAAIASIAFYVILDIEFPRSGLIQIDVFDHALVKLRSGMS
jgi:hypothetical protein